MINAIIQTVARLFSGAQLVERKMRADCPRCGRDVAIFHGRKPGRSGVEGPLGWYFYRHTCLRNEQRSWVEAPRLGIVEER